MPFRKKIDNGAERLAGVAFFQDFTPKELNRVAELVEEVDADEGAELIDQGRPGLECYVIVEGTAGVYINGERKAVLGPGEMVGEMALIDHRPRSATVRALSPMKLLALDAKRFKTLLSEMPKASQQVMAKLSDLVRKADLE
jgi:CRP/FNR family cyclic AMP-dependent transcriptional regulator